MYTVHVDTDKIGFKLLEKMGWSSGQGLGSNQQGMVHPLSIQPKTDLLGKNLFTHPYTPFYTIYLI